MAGGEIGLDFEYFYRITPRQFFNICDGYFVKKQQHLKFEMILNRGLKFAIVAPHLKNQNATPEEVFPLYWELDSENKSMDLEKQRLEIEASKKRWKRLDAKNKRLEKLKK